MKKILEIVTKKNLIIIIALIIISFLITITFIPNGLFNFIRNKIQKEDSYSLSYKIYKYFEENDTYKILITITNPDGIKSIEYDDITINCYGKKKVAIDHDAVDFQNYNFIITLSNGTIRNETLNFERQRMGKDAYKQVNSSDVYVNEPNLEGYEEEFTRYLQYSSDDILKPANWITNEQPVNWYNYKDRKWANIYVENEGVESYYVWIPRYCYKLDTQNKRTDIKFIDVYNRYIDADTGQTIEWETLKQEGYKIPEAFEWGEFKEVVLSGYWMTKYELADLSYYGIDYNLTASESSFEISNLTKNTDKEVAKYTYAINGQLDDYESTTLENRSLTNVVPDRENVINVTALDSNGSIVASMTKKIELVKVNEPDLTGFNPDTTFYVYWDEDGNKHTEIPISQPPPDNWYNYTYSKWANIVSINNNLETYFVWIPRYQYMLNNTKQRVDTKFIEGNGTETLVGYQIPEAFSWGDGDEKRELYGYWITKYELSE